MCDDSEYCPLGLIDNCIAEKNLFTDEISCINFYYCSMQTRPWSLPFRYEERDGIMTLVVVYAYIDTGNFLSINYRHTVWDSMAEYGWAVAVTIPLKIDDDFDDLPW